MNTPQTPSEQPLAADIKIIRDEYGCEVGKCRECKISLKGKPKSARYCCPEHKKQFEHKVWNYGREAMRMAQGLGQDA